MIRPAKLYYRTYTFHLWIFAVFQRQKTLFKALQINETLVCGGYTRNFKILKESFSLQRIKKDYKYKVLAFLEKQLYLNGENRFSSCLASHHTQKPFQTQNKA